METAPVIPKPNVVTTDLMLADAGNMFHHHVPFAEEESQAIVIVRTVSTRTLKQSVHHQDRISGLTALKP